ncbi:hypothetical protein [Gorillibacterium sp. sgz5001074]|uniref:hypothetical protein n=1 Tax=Gorillibacterium sp. sgz5001074 TaxID=3446695 RepID=UPI003F667B7F
MSFQMTGAPQTHVVYKAEPSMMHHLKSMRDHLHHLCKMYMNHRVRIETMDGHVYEGYIVHCDKGLLYLSTTQPGHPGTHGGGQHGGHRPLNPSSAYYYNNVILPLVLYELLVITLMLI